MTADIDHWFGQDTGTSVTGDLQPVTGVDRGRQRILRRLMTVPGTYITHPDYGAGLPRYIGAVPDVPEIRALILEQMELEAAVGQDPAPQVAIQPIQDGVAVTLRYLDAPEQVPVVLAFDVTR
ncbi:hypothetical protein SAMN02949497_3408 [Methylomagnum ishizawai]|uniref:Phage tail protein n=1 Tax=Methylomagnum ishizawai TaxID=1760988 RepID=A0A1Y6CZC5_9GAMM|nr:hypothetical protein [Methylomagnum ishizawai]SMF96028.1 hypothetical protein SAMN02949497_3408 [Methylomagnum ishizawai]